MKTILKISVLVAGILISLASWGYFFENLSSAGFGNKTLEPGKAAEGLVFSANKKLSYKGRNIKLRELKKTDTLMYVISPSKNLVFIQLCSNEVGKEPCYIKYYYNYIADKYQSVNACGLDGCGAVLGFSKDEQIIYILNHRNERALVSSFNTKTNVLHNITEYYHQQSGCLRSSISSSGIVERGIGHITLRVVYYCNNSVMYADESTIRFAGYAVPKPELDPPVELKNESEQGYSDLEETEETEVYEEAEAYEEPEEYEELEEDINIIEEHKSL